MSKTLIAWTDETLNPLVGCSKISEGCRSCYAETRAASPRLQQFPQYQGVIDKHGHWNGHIEFVPKQLDKLFHMKKPRRIFMPSMSDPFHENVKDEWLDQIMAAIALNPHLTVQMLTKRPERMKGYFMNYRTKRNIEKEGNRLATEKNLRTIDADGIKLVKFPYECMDWPLPNLWLGVTVENQAAANKRIPVLLQTPAAVSFLSVEPMVEEIDLSECPDCGGSGESWDSIADDYIICQKCKGKGFTDQLSDIDQVIIGGESGSNARPFHLEWAESIIQQCQEAGVAVFVKQVGSNAFYQGQPFKTKSRAGTDPSEWPEHLRIQQFPGVQL